jgi:hypothetical protein
MISIILEMTSQIMITETNFEKKPGVEQELNAHVGAREASKWCPCQLLKRTSRKSQELNRS